MRLAVYGLRDENFPLVLVPECMMPSLQMKRSFGELQLRGAVELDEWTINAVANPTIFNASTCGLEYAVTSEFQARRILTALAAYPCA